MIQRFKFVTFAICWLNPAMYGAVSTAPTTSVIKSIADAGAIGDGTTLNTASIQSAIDELAASGGGTLVVPKGVFVCGAIFLKPAVNLQLVEGSVLKGSNDLKDYPKTLTRIEGHFQEWLPALVNADHSDHLRITGSGTIDGSGAPFWKEFKDRIKADTHTTNLDVPRPRLMLIQNSDDVQIDGVTFKDSGFWNLHLYHCTNSIVEKSHFEVPDGIRCPSTDGTDIDSCQNITIRGCTYRVDDDCIAMKGSKGPMALEDKQSPPVEHIRISDCTFERGNGVTLGSEATVVRDVIVEHCDVVGPINLVCLKLRPDTPQHYEDIHYHDITLKSGGGTIFAIRPWRQYFDLRGQPPPKSVVTNVTLSDIKGSYGSFGVIQGNVDQTDISDISLDRFDVQLKNATPKIVNVKGLEMNNITINGKALTSIPTTQP